MSNLRQLLLISFILALASCDISTPKPSHSNQSSSLDSNIDAYIQRHVENGRFNGSLLIGKGDSLVYQKAFGMADRSFETPNDPATKFMIGSITKPFAALAIMILVEQGKLGLDDTLSTYFPSFPSSKKITISQLLNHTAGLDDYQKLSDWKADSKSDLTSPQSTVEKMRRLPLLSEPGEQFRYSNVGYILLGLIIEQVTEQSFADFIQDEILNPLELKNTGVAKNHAIIPHLAKGYSSSPKETLHAEYINYKQPFSSGNMYSTPNDLWLFTKAVMGGKLLSEKTTQAIFNSGKHYGYGWGLRTFGKTKAFGHYGGMNGFVGAITFIPEDDWFICLLTNDENTPKARITNDLVSIIKGEDVPLPTLTKSIALSERIKAQVLGDYLVKAGDTLSIFEEKGVLYMQETGQRKHALFPYEDYAFCFKFLEFNAVFEDIRAEKTQVLRLEGRETILEAKRI